MSSHQTLVFLLQTGLLIAVAAGLGRAAALIRLPPVVGELAAGLVLGPTLLGALAPSVRHWLFGDLGQQQLLAGTAQLGVLMLVATTGAQLDLGLLRRRRRVLGLVSLGSVLLPLLLGAALGLLLPGSLIGPAGERRNFALLIGVAVAVSALPVIAKTLLDLRLLHRDVGQLVIGAAAVSDILGWMLLSVVSASATHGLRAGPVAASVGGLLAVVGLTVLLVRGAIRRTARLEQPPDACREQLPAPRPGFGSTAVVVAIVLSAAGTQALGLEPVLGAFLCGIVLSALGPAGRQPLDALRPFVMAVLVPLFLATAGLRVDLTVLARPQVAAAAAATLAVAVAAKLAGGYLGARLARLGRAESLAVGAGLNARGVVEIVLASVGLRLGVLNTASYTVIVLVALATSMLTPPILRAAATRIPRTPEEAERERRFTAG